jgi:thermopsin
VIPKAAVVALVAMATVGWMGLATTALVAPAASPVGLSASAASSATPSTTHAPASPAPSVPTAGNPAASMAASALAATRAAGLPTNVVFVPRPSASPAQLARTADSGVVSPLYTGLPAPLGLADYGLSNGADQSVVGSVVNTTELQGTVDANATGIVGGDLYQSSPDSYGVQLNAVLTNINLFGSADFSFWAQDVVEYYPSSGLMVLVTNVWNFSGGSYAAGNAIFSHGPDGTNAWAALGYYYAESIVPFPVAYPFNLTLTMVSSLSGGRDNVSFAVELNSTAHPDENFSAPYDWVVFNSLRAGAPGLTVPSNFTANGLSYNPIGLTDDFELDICGPGGGSQVDLTAADATLGLAYNVGGILVAVPSAYNYGGETGETATGASVTWSNVPGGPGGLTDYGTMSTGPAFLSGLWGTGAPMGSFPVQIVTAPGNAFNFLQYNGTPTFNSPNFTVQELSYAPSVTTHTFDLMPGNWELVTELSEYAPVAQTLSVAGPMTVPIVLASDPALGVYTPLWAFNNSDAAALSSSGSGTPTSPYLIENNQLAAFSSLFGLYNDYTFPVFPGVWFMDTSASVEFYQPPSLSATTNDFQFPGIVLPATNDLQYWFWNVTNVSVVDAANISGWFGDSAWYPTSFDSFNMIFYESSNNLIAGNTFGTESQALLLFGGGTFFGPLNVGGNDNTVWGNTFNEVPSPASCQNPSASVNGCEVLLPYGLGLGVEVAENDTIYNNYFATPTTAWELPINLYTGYPELFSTLWNITPEPASDVTTLPAFPTLPLSGSIIGTADQGGNFWWDYGSAFNPYNGANNPYGVIPYTEFSTTFIAQLYPGLYNASWIYPGDFDPLSSVALYAVTLSEHGLALGATWTAFVVDPTGMIYYDAFATNAASQVIYLPTGTYYIEPQPPAEYTAPAAIALHVVGHATRVTIPFRLAPGYSILTFREVGLPAGTSWSVTVNGTTPVTDLYNATATSTGNEIQVLVTEGTYDYSVTGTDAFAPSVPTGTLAVTFSHTVVVHFSLVRYAVTFTESGLPAGAHWALTIEGPVHGPGTLTSSVTVRSAATTASSSLPDGTYEFTVSAPRGYACYVGYFLVAGGPASVAVSCFASGGDPSVHAVGGPASSPAMPRAAGTPARGGGL